MYRNTNAITSPPINAVLNRIVPIAMPCTIDQRMNVVSRVSFSTFRNRTTAKTASSPNAMAILPAISSMTSETITGIATSDVTNVREYDRLVCVSMYTHPTTCPTQNDISRTSSAVFGSPSADATSPYSRISIHSLTDRPPF